MHRLLNAWLAEAFIWRCRGTLETIVQIKLGSFTRELTNTPNSCNPSSLTSWSQAFVFPCFWVSIQQPQLCPEGNPLLFSFFFPESLKLSFISSLLTHSTHMVSIANCESLFLPVEEKRCSDSQIHCGHDSQGVKLVASKIVASWLMFDLDTSLNEAGANFLSELKRAWENKQPLYS